MHQQKSKKIIIYFFLLISVGSINNISLSNFKFKSIKNINVTGLGDFENTNLTQDLKKLNLDNIFFINEKNIRDQINSNHLVEKYEVFKIYPSSLYINVKKTKFLARVKKNGKEFLIGSNGKFSKNDFFKNQLPFIFGSPQIDEFLKFKYLVDKSRISYEEIKNLYFFPSKRWDLELKNNKVIRLSKNNLEESLELASNFLYNSEFKDIKTIDARVKNQIILND